MRWLGRYQVRLSLDDIPPSLRFYLTDDDGERLFPDSDFVYPVLRTNTDTYLKMPAGTLEDDYTALFGASFHFIRFVIFVPEERVEQRKDDSRYYIAYDWDRDTFFDGVYNDRHYFVNISQHAVIPDDATIYVARRLTIPVPSFLFLSYRAKNIDYRTVLSDISEYDESSFIYDIMARSANVYRTRK